MNKFFQSAIAWIKDQAAHLFTALQPVAQEAVQAGAADLDALVHKYTPVAVAQVSALKDSDLSTAEKRSTAFTKIAETLEADGHDIGAEGFNSFVNLLVELGVNLMKAIEGVALGQPAKTGG